MDTRLKSVVGQKPEMHFFPDDDAKIANVKPTAETTTATIPFFKFAEEEEDEEEEEVVLASSAESNKGALSGSISLME